MMVDNEGFALTPAPPHSTPPACAWVSEFLNGFYIEQVAGLICWYASRGSLHNVHAL